MSYELQRRKDGVVIILNISGGERKYDHITAKAMMDVVICSEGILGHLRFGDDGFKDDNHGTVRLSNNTLFSDKIIENVFIQYGCKVIWDRRSVKKNGLFIQYVGR